MAITTAFPNDVPAPAWALNVIPTDGSPSGGGPSSSDSVNLASGVEENTPGPDIAGRNPQGPSAVFSRMYRSVQAAKGYASPGLSPGWTHNYDITVRGATGTWGSLALNYPNGAQEQWGPALDGNGAPTGTLYPAGNGVPYLVQGMPSPNTVGQWLALTLTWKDRTTWTFTPDPNNSDSYLLTRIANAVGRGIYINYDQTHRLLSVTDDAAPTVHNLLSFQYNAGYLTSITDPYARTVNFTFAQTTGGFCLTGVSQLTSNALQWAYDYSAINGWPLLSSVGAPDPSVIPAPGAAVPILTHPITYYGDGRVATQVDANGNRRLYTYAGGAQVQVYSPAGVLVDHWSQASGALNNAMGYTDANNASNQVVYGDPMNPYRPTQFTNRNPANVQTVSATYDQFGNTLTTQASCNGGIVQTNYQYDYSTFALGMLSTVQQQGMGGNVHYTYYPNGLVKTVTTPTPGWGFGTLMSNEVPPTTTYVYAPLGNIQEVWKPAPNGTGQIVKYIYNYTNDPLDGTQQTEALGKPLTITSPGGAITHFRYDARGNCTTIIDAMGNHTDMTYNDADQLRSTILPATGQTGGGRAHTDITYQYIGGPAIATKAYDESGNNTPVRQVGQTSGKEGEALAQTGNTEQASFTYDADQRLNTLKDGNGNAFGHAYDAVGNLSQLTYPSGNSIHGQYDLDGNLTQFTNARGQHVHTTLVPGDSLPQSMLHDDGHSEQFVYDRFGRTTRVSDGNTTLDYTYDDLSNVLSATTTYANLPALPAVYYGYYPDGSRAYMYQFGTPTLYTYDLDGHLTDVRNRNLGYGTYHYDYDLLGRLIHKKTPQTETNYQYNAIGQLVAMINYDGTHNVVSGYSSIGYDGAGNLTQMTVATVSLNPTVQGPLTSGTVHYFYDTQDHLTREQSQRNLTVPGFAMDIGAFDNPSVSDAADNLTQLRGVTFSGNIDNQITADSNGAGYGYNLDGNATTEEGVNAQYDDEGHLTAYANLTFGYRPDGLRAWKQVGAGPQTYFLNLDEINWPSRGLFLTES
ncbi:MAG: tRNA3(Ser)-specific nuclease WapA [Chthonomonadaceae bacterium]|nr:tRNA3(Ser)-specific nuclease WapA [Chthonomonadaceae bacterium]